MDKDIRLLIIQMGWYFVNPISMGIILACFDYFHWVKDMMPIVYIGCFISIGYMFGMIIYMVYFHDRNLQT